MDWPKCERCEGKGKTFPYISAGEADEIRAGELAEPEWGTCPACNGTGERDLTADEAAEYLRAQKVYWHHGYDPAKKTWFIMGTEHGYKYNVLGEGETLTKALNAACRAVRNKG